MGYPREPGGRFGREKREEEHENTTKNKEKEPKIHQKSVKMTAKTLKNSKNKVKTSTQIKDIGCFNVVGVRMQVSGTG